MRKQSIDTSLQVEKVLISLLKKATIAQKFSQVRFLSKRTMSLSRRAISRVNKDLNNQEVNLLFIKYHYGEDLAIRLMDYLNKNKNG